MKTQFDIIEAAKKWCSENGHDGFYYAGNGDPCGCHVDDLAPCGCEQSLYNGDCKGGKLVKGEFIDGNGEHCDEAIVPHDWSSDK